jgi:hypothetical protein
MKERRLYPRRHFRTKVVFEDEFRNGLFFEWSEDISVGGIFLASDIPVRLGALLYLSFVLPPHKRPIRVTGEVVRFSPSKGMGIRFVGLSDIAKKRLGEFIG